MKKKISMIIALMMFTVLLPVANAMPVNAEEIDLVSDEKETNERNAAEEISTSILLEKKEITDTYCKEEVSLHNDDEDIEPYNVELQGKPLRYGYSINSDGKTITITSISIMEDDYDSVNIPSSIDCLTVTAIGNGRDPVSTVLKGNLVIPSSVTTIQSEAFMGCSGLSGDLIIPDNVTKIGSSAFSGCSGFTGCLTISNNVTSIYDDTFLGCSGFTGKLIIPSNVTYIGNNAFKNCRGFSDDLIIPNGITTIGNYAFYDCDGFSGRLIIPDSVTSIGKGAFISCSGLVGKLIIPNSVKKIGESAFWGCDGFSGDLIIPEGVVSIESRAFAACNGLSGSLVIPNSVTSIGENIISVQDITEIINNSETEYKLPTNNAQWFNGETGEKITKIKNGVAIKRNYTGSPFVYYINLDNTTLTIVGYNGNASGELVIPEKIDGHKVTVIDNGVFSGCSGLTGELIIPDSVKNIGEKAFQDCSGLSGLKFGKGLTVIGSQAFSGCNKISGKLSFPNNVTDIGKEAFSGCCSLSELELGTGVKIIGDYAFNGCTGFQGNLTIPNSVLTLGDYAFNGCTGFNRNLTIGDGITKIPQHAFLGCSGFMGNLIIGNNVTIIEKEAFRGIKFLGTLTLGNKIQTIGDSAFAGCSGFTGTLTIPSSVTSIGDHAFYNCSGFTGKLIFPDSLTGIGAYAFYCCTGFSGDLIIPCNVKHIGGSSFYKCTGLGGDLVLGEKVETIGSEAFCYCSHLQGNLTIGNKVKSIGSKAFFCCEALTGDLTIPNSVTDIEFRAFGACYKLDGKLTIGNNVKTIGSQAFASCRQLKGNLIIPDSVETIGSEAFSGCRSLDGNLIISNSISSIEEKTFFDCIGLTGNISIPDSVIGIKEDAFYNCSGFNGKLIIPSSIAGIGAYAFGGCIGITKVINYSESIVPLPESEGKVWKDATTGQTVTSIVQGTATRSDHKLYTVGFDSQGGTLVNAIINIDSGDSVVLPQNPIKKDALFNGWYTEPNGQGKEFTEETPVVANMMVYAYWKNLYTVSFDSQGGSLISSIGNIVEGEIITLPTSPTKSKANFKGWYSKPNGQGTKYSGKITVRSNLTLYAYWKNIYTLSFDSQGGSNVLAITKEEGTIVYLPENTIKQDAIFKGWYSRPNGQGLMYSGKITIIDNLTLYAYWKNLYTVSFDSQGGTDVASLDEVEDGTSIELPVVPTKTGMKFKGWYTEKNGKGTEFTQDTKVIGNTTLYAYWKNLYSVTFDAQGGTDVGSLNEVEDGTTIELPAPPTKSGVKFKGWYTEISGKGTEFTQDTKVTGNTTLYAYWKNLYSVTFDVQGGTDIPSVEEIEDGTTINLPNAPTKGGLLFDGWYSEPEGNGAKFTEETIVTDNITVYANWKVKKGFDVYGIESEYEYTGQQIKPKIYVYKDGVLLSEGSDYSVIYKNNINVASIDSAKSPNVIINGKGNYSGSVVIPFSIVPKSIGDGTEWADEITFSIADKQYNGKEQKSKPTIKFGKLTLKENRDYSLNYSGNLYNCGEVNVLITAKDGSNFVGSAELTYSIYKQGTNLSSLYIPAIPSQTYCGVDIDLTNLIIVRETKSSSDSFIKDIDYTVSYVKGSNRRNVGTATILLTGISDRCIGSKTVTFKIVPKAVSAEMFEVEGVSYNGTSLKPEVAMKDAGVAVDASNYTVSYSKNVDAADVSAKNAPTATIKGKGNYTGTVKIPFSITPLELTVDDLDISMSDIKDNGKAITEAVVKPVVKYANPVTGKTVTLKKGKDYSIDYSRGDDDNNQTAKIILKGNYANKQGDDIAFNFRLFKSQTVLNTEDFSVEITDSDITYTGSKITPAVTVNERTEGEPRILQEGKDFTVSYSNNINAADKDLPDANVKKLPTVKITGKGLYKGTVSKTFTIGKKVLSEDDFDIVIEDVKCNPNKNQVPKVTITNKAIGKALKKTDYTVEVKGTTVAPKEAAEIVITGQGNYGGEPLNLTFRVYEKSINSAVFEKIENQSYTGDQICPDGDFVKIYADKKKTVKLKEGVDYRLEYGTNVKTGTGTITVIGLGEYGGTKKLTFKIVPMKLKYIYDGLTMIVCKDGPCYVTQEQLKKIHATWDFAGDAIEMAGHHNIGELEAIIGPVVRVDGSKNQDNSDNKDDNKDKPTGLIPIHCKDGTCYVTPEQLDIIHATWDFAGDAIEMAGHHNIGELEAVIGPTVH